MVVVVSTRDGWGEWEKYSNDFKLDTTIQHEVREDGHIVREAGIQYISYAKILIFFKSGKKVNHNNSES